MKQGVFPAAQGRRGSGRQGDWPMRLRKKKDSEEFRSCLVSSVLHRIGKLLTHLSTLSLGQLLRAVLAF